MRIAYSNSYGNGIYTFTLFVKVLLRKRLNLTFLTKLCLLCVKAVDLSV